MNDKTLEILKKALNACGRYKEPLKADDSWRVELHKYGVHGTGPDPVTHLKTVITTADRPEMQLFSGFIGSGKSTELNKLVKELENEGYTPLLIDYEDYFNLYEPPTASDLLTAVAAGIDEFIKERCNTGKYSFWESIHNFLSGIEFAGMDVQMGAANAVGLKLKFQRDVSFKSALYKHLENRGSVGAFENEILSLLDQSLGIITKTFRDTKGLVVVVDTFERVTGNINNAGDVREAIRRIFIDKSDLLRNLPFHTVYAVPPWLRFHDFVASLDIVTLPMCRLKDQYSGERVDRGFDAMRDILKKRMDFKKVFADAEPVDDLIEKSGGYPRDLLRMMREVLLQAIMDDVDLPIPKVALTKLVRNAYEMQIERFNGTIFDEDLDMLCKISRTRDLPQQLDQKEKGIFQIAEMFNHHFVLTYRNGNQWYDLHPLVEETPRVKKALQKDNESDRD